MESRNNKIDLWAAALVTMLVLTLTRCENTDLTAPSDGQLILTAVPASAVVDEDTGRGRATIQAVVLEANGVPLEGATVVFSPSSGSLVDNRCQGAVCSGSGDACTTDADCPLGSPKPVSRKTNSKGLADVPLVVTADDEENVTVTGSSGALAGAASVFNELGRVNGVPVASFTVFPPGPATNGGPIDLDGTGSVDPDGDPITCYQWTINSSIPIEAPAIDCIPPAPQCTVVQGPQESFTTLSYNEEQRLSITLRVSDDPDALPCPRSGPAVDRALLNGTLDSLTTAYIICNNTAPVSVPGDYGPVALVGGTVDVALDGSGSSDAETPNGQMTFRWDCGSLTNQVRTGIQAVCTYITSGTKMVTLTVTDPGNGEVACGKNDATTTTIVVN